MSDTRVLRIGIASRDYVKQRTMDVVGGSERCFKVVRLFAGADVEARYLFAVGPNEPRHWVSSLESLAKVLTDRNMLLLEMIRNTQPQSMAELAKRSGRAKSNLSRTLHTMESLGLIELSVVTGGKKVPTVIYDRLTFDFSLLPKKLDNPKVA